MVTDILIQVGLGLITVFMFLIMHGIPQKVLTKFRFRNRPQFQAKRHFVIGAQLLARARSAPSRSASNSLSKEALAEAEKAIALDPKDAAAHILKALALDLQGFKTSALDSLDVALSPLAIKSLSDQEHGDALFKRAELKMAMSRRGQVDSALADLTQAVELVEDRGKVFRLLGECYEEKKMKDEAVKAYEDALAAEPTLVAAREALDRLRS
ncbi:hypothetical protein FNV43_RR12438 [Rhamnella rubrinervis]|uniref:Tetratricopeptide repeat protein n=1 Tax=Rhamnella rubrinervis TaxID=2594499 RepID=A0A8K0H7Z0_9ROSA|nr:hypothetical protein FNV43_RR12438 [Rhamnella rubrinervis]